MKTLKMTIGALLITSATLFLMSCKKESAAPQQKTTQEKISGKLNLSSSVVDHFYAGSSHVMNYTGTPADYADFRADGKVYSFVNGAYDTAAFAVISDTKMWIDNSTYIFDIQKLTDSELAIYNKEIISVNEYEEVKISFKK